MAYTPPMFVSRYLSIQRTLPLLVALVLGCNDSGFTSVGPDGALGDASVTTADLGQSCTDEDTDNDTILDCEEGIGDTDGDGTPDLEDTDADGDGLPDQLEAGDADPQTAPADSDGDKIPDFKDTDSDNDGLPDAEELQLGTTPTSNDTDGDGLPDLAEVTLGTDPKDPVSGLKPGEFFVILPYMGKHQLRDLSFGTTVQKADVYVLMDTSTTMNGEIANITSSLQSVIVPGLAQEINDVAMGVGHFEDLPVSPYGTGSFHAYENLQSITTDTAKVQQAVSTLATCCVPDGSTMPESQVVALHATVTGKGLGGFYADAPSCAAGHFGYPCFRPQALPVIVLVTDAMFHNGPNGANAYDFSVSPPPPTYGAMLTELKARGAKVVGVFSGVAGEDAHTVKVVTDTGAVDLGGQPLVFSIDPSGSGLGQSVVTAIKNLAGNVARDVDTTRREAPDVDDGIDAANFIKAIMPKSAQPADGFASKDSTTFYTVVPGTQLLFEVDFHNDFVQPEPVDRAYQALIEVRGDKTVLLDSRRVLVIVPRQDSSIVIE